jgi:protein-tyrosine phosphatase
LQKGGLLKKIRATVTYEDMAITYANLPFDNPGYEAMVKAIKDKDVPLLQHCFAGKDRAGVGVAIALMVLGISRDEIMKDYMASKEYEKEFLFLPMRWLPTWIRKIAQKRGEVLFTVDPMLLNATFNSIDEKYGDTNTFLREEYGLTAEDLNEIRDYYLEG